MNRAVERIFENPRQFPKLHGEFRRVLLASFPFGIFYRALADEVMIVMVFPLRDNPLVLERRLKREQ